jgi:hypothetical protein
MELGEQTPPEHVPALWQGVAVQVIGDPVHTPPWQESPVVQALPSSQDMRARLWYNRRHEELDIVRLCQHDRAAWLCDQQSGQAGSGRC